MRRVMRKQKAFQFKQKLTKMMRVMHRELVWEIGSESIKRKFGCFPQTRFKGFTICMPNCSMPASHPNHALLKTRRHTHTHQANTTDKSMSILKSECTYLRHTDNSIRKPQSWYMCNRARTHLDTCTRTHQLGAPWRFLRCSQRCLPRHACLLRLSCCLDWRATLQCFHTSRKSPQIELRQVY